MVAALSSVDLLAESIQHTFFAINTLILASNDNAAEAASLPVPAVAALEQRLQSIIGNGPDLATSAMALALFERPLACYLRSMQCSVSCYTMARRPLFSFIGTNGGDKLLLHSHAPTFWQRLLNVCHLYRITIKIDITIDREIGGTSVRFNTPDSAETVFSRTRSAIPWRFSLTPEQEWQLRALPKIVARTGIWPPKFTYLRAWMWPRQQAASSAKRP
jgi:hypothetical protein